MKSAATQLAASGNTAIGVPVLVRLVGHKCEGGCVGRCVGGLGCGGWHAPINGNKAVIVASSAHKGERRWVLQWMDQTSRSRQKVTWPADTKYAKHKTVTNCGRKWEVMWG
jgi:hypothetical protein